MTFTLGLANQASDEGVTEVTTQHPGMLRVTVGWSVTSFRCVRPVMLMHGECGARETLSRRRQCGGDGCQFGH